jgi:hypothetical protein
MGGCTLIWQVYDAKRKSHKSNYWLIDQFGGLVMRIRSSIIQIDGLMIQLTRLLGEVGVYMVI